MMRRRALLALLLALLVTLATACGSGDDGDDAADGGGEEAEGGGEPSGDLTVRFMGDPQPIHDQFAEDFMAEYPDVTVELQHSPWTEAHDQFTTEMAGGSVIDVSEVGNTWTREFADLGGLEPLESLDVGELPVGMVESASLDGTQFGMPWYAGARGLIYRTDILEEAGITEPPATWDDLEAAAAAITEQFNGEPFAFAAPGVNMHEFMPMIWQAGGEIATEEGDGYAAALNSPEAAEAWDFFKSFHDNGYAPADALTWNSLNAQEAFAAGQVAMMVGGGWDVFQMLENNPDIEANLGTALLPEGPGGSRETFAGGSDLVVFEGSDNKDAAKAWVEFMVRPDNVSAFAEEVPGFFPGNADGIEETATALGDLYAPFAEQLLDHTRSYPVGAGWGALEGAEVFQNTMQEVLGGQTSTEDGLASLADQMNAEF
jgi:N,N'-diacetylchitobiose transport system substrate-binding protein